MLFDCYAYANRWRGRHPAEKGLLAGLALAAALSARAPSAALTVFACLATLTVAGAGIPPAVYLRLLLLPAGFLVTGVASLTVSCSGGDLLLGTLPGVGVPVFLNAAGVTQAMLVLARALAALAALYFLALTTPLTEVIGLLRRLRVSHLLLELMVLAYRQIFLFAQIAREMRTAQLARLGYATSGNSLRSLAALGANLYLRVHLRSRLLHRALVCRGYEGDLHCLERDCRLSAVRLLSAAVTGSLLLAVAWLVPG